MMTDHTDSWGVHRQAECDSSLPLGQDERSAGWMSPMFGFLLVLLLAPLCAHVIGRYTAAPEPALIQLERDQEAQAPRAKGARMGRDGTRELDQLEREAGAATVRRPFKGTV